MLWLDALTKPTRGVVLISSFFVCLQWQLLKLIGCAYGSIIAVTCVEGIRLVGSQHRLLIVVLFLYISLLIVQLRMSFFVVLLFALVVHHSSESDLSIELCSALAVNRGVIPFYLIDLSLSRCALLSIVVSFCLQL